MKHAGQLMPLHSAVQHSSETSAGMWPGSALWGVVSPAAYLQMTIRWVRHQWLVKCTVET